jgi:hypothetical protein
VGQFFVFARELNEIGRVIFETIVFDKESVEPTNGDQFSLPAMCADLLIGESLKKLLEVLALNSGREIQTCFLTEIEKFEQIPCVGREGIICQTFFNTEIIYPQSQARREIFGMRFSRTNSIGPLRGDSTLHRIGPLSGISGKGPVSGFSTPWGGIDMIPNPSRVRGQTTAG